MKTVTRKELIDRNGRGECVPSLFSDPVHIPDCAIQILGVGRRPDSVGRPRKWVTYRCDLCGKEYTRLPSAVFLRIKEGRAGCAECRTNDASGRESPSRAPQGPSQEAIWVMPVASRKPLHPANMAYRRELK